MYSLSVFISRILVVLCLSLAFLGKSIAASSELSDRPEELEAVSSPERVSAKTEVVVPDPVDGPYLLKDSQLEAVVELDPESKEQGRIKSLNLQVKNWKENWKVRFIEEKDTKAISEILSQQSAEKIIYLPDPTKEEEVLRWQKRVIERQPHYRPLIIEDQQSRSLGLIEVHTMSRAVSDLSKQEDILRYYYDKGLISYEPSNPVQELKTETGFPYTYGKYRPINNGGMVRLRVMPVATVAHNVAFLADVIKGVSSLVRMFSEELSYPLHTYPTDKDPGKPKVIMSYTALEHDLRQAFERAGFSLDENPVFGEFWPPTSQSRLPLKKVVAMQSISEILPWSPISLQLVEKSKIIKHIDESSLIVPYLEVFSPFLGQADEQYKGKLSLSYTALIVTILGYMKGE